MAGAAAIISVVDMHKSGTISRQRVTELIRPYHIKQLTSDTIDQEELQLLNSFCSGVSVLPRSAVSARVYFTGDAALRAKSQGEKVCLCKKTFLPTDTVVMREMDAIISLTSAAVHVVTICQSLGIPALLSLEKNGVTLQPDGGLINSSGREIKEGDWITISSRRRAIYEGKAKFKPARLLRYMRGEPVEMDEEESKSFASIAYAYRYYQQLTRGLEVDQISTLSEVTRLVNFELRGESEEAQATCQWLVRRPRNAVHGRGPQERHWRPPGPKQRFRDAHPGPQDQVLQAGACEMLPRTHLRLRGGRLYAGPVFVLALSRRFLEVLQPVRDRAAGE